MGVAIKLGLEKLSLSMPYRQWMNQALADLRASLLPITVEYAEVQAGLPYHHRDPFDRLIIAQALVEKVPVIGADSVFEQYGVVRIG
jgi:PIN domain nuclease of toxin-antitoxin system